MAFKFRWLCDLLEKLEQNRVAKVLTASRTANPDDQVVVTWFNKHHAQIPRHGAGAVAFLSSLFPERRSDRVYNLQRKRLASTFGRSLGLGSGRMKELHGWQERHGSDFPQCIEAVMAQAEFGQPAPGHELTLDELDQALDELAARSSFSSPTIRSRCDPREANVILGSLLQRLQSWEAKWLVRIILKNFSPVIVPEQLAMDQYHFLLRDLLNMQSSFEAVVAILSRPRISRLRPRPAHDSQTALKLGIMEDLAPQVGVMVRRPSYEKARSIKHCCQMAATRRMSLERKYDGEYCQVHIDLANGTDCITIFSKSGKDSTADRVRLHGVLKDCLGISAAEGRIKQNCILEGELLVWNKSTFSIEPFYKIRKHVQRSGRWLGNQADSPASLHENLMIMFYDILLLDDKVILRESHRKRRQRLEALVKATPGYAGLGTREIIDFFSPSAAEQLRTAFAAAITRHWEGFVLKGCDDPYIPVNGAGRYIKLKKDYITGLGDTLDFAIAGGRRDPRVEQELNLGKLSWTSFYIGCLENKMEVQKSNEKPVYRIVDVVGEHNISKDDMLFLNEHGRFVQVPFAASREELDVKIDQKSMARPTELFKQAFVAEIYGAGFEKLANARTFTLRFPRVLKIHSDRGVSDTVSFDELQEIGRSSHQVPLDVDSQKDRDWIERLERAEPKSHYIVDQSQSTSPGRIHRSAATASENVTPNMRTKLHPPVLVRADTGKLSPTELFERERTKSSRRFCSQASVHGRSQPSKRKSLSTDVSPEPNMSSKRIKLSKMLHTAPQIHPLHQSPDFDPCATASSSAACATALRDPAARGGLQSTPPWCKWSSPSKASSISPRNLDGISAPRDSVTQSPTKEGSCSVIQRAPIFRRPLSDITNSSPENSFHRVTSTFQPSTDRSKGSDGPKLVPASTITKIMVEATSVKARARCTIVPSAKLPTPPGSSAILVGFETSTVRSKTGNAVPPSSDPQPDKLATPKKGHRSRRTVSATTPSHTSIPLAKALYTPNTASPPPPPPLSNSRAFAPPVLLSQCLSHLHTHPTRPLETLLQCSPVAFTYSETCFLDNLQTTSKKPHIVLVDTTRPTAVAKEMKAILKLLQLKISESALERPGKVIFLDFNCLTTFDDMTGPATIYDMKQHFGGCLAWDPKHVLRSDGNNKKGRNEPVRAVFNWEEALAFGGD